MATQIVTSAFPAASWPETTPETETKQKPEIGPREIEKIASDWLQRFNNTLKSADYAGLDTIFHAESWWRDLLSMKMDFQLLHRTDQMKAALKADGKSTEFSNFTLSSVPAPCMQNPLPEVTWIQGFFEYETRIGRGRGVFRLLPENAGSLSNWKCFTMFTSIEELKGYEEQSGSSRKKGVAHGENVKRKAWVDARKEKINFENAEPTVVIVGSGQAGLNLAARLGQLNVDTLIVDKNDRVGDNWRKRYRFLVLHDPVWYDHMAYMPFPTNWPVFTPKDKLGDWFEHYANAMELNVWTKTEVKGATFDPESSTWTVPVKRADGTIRELHPKHLVLATGHSGEANIPTFEGQDTFKGKIVHSSQHTTGQDWDGKHAVVVGCCNSGHDISHDFYEQGANTTIVQRSSTYIMSSENGLRILFEGLYEENGPSTEDADMIFQSIPNPLHCILQKATTEKIAEADAPLLEGLQKAGFKLDFGDDGSGFLMKYFKRGGGYYLDVGASSLISDGKIKVKQGQEIKRFKPDGIEFADGSFLKADVVVLATGYQNMRTTVARVISKDVADKCEEVWGLDSSGELKTIWRASGHENFWFMGGNLALCRYFSRRLALQIKMIEEGLATHPNKGDPVATK